MVSNEAITAVDQTSCVLSMIGSTLVVLTWAYPVENRKKHGRILLLWLSVSDFMSSLVYLTQTFTDNAACEAMALLGIFFPVASFLWTDFIAYFIYLVIVNRGTYDWNRLLRLFHIVTWSLSSIIVIIVGSSGHAGRADDGDDATFRNTGGWCWIKGGSSQDRFIWEIVGGKFIEWTSYLIIIPAFYALIS